MRLAEKAFREDVLGEGMGDGRKGCRTRVCLYVTHRTLLRDARDFGVAATFEAFEVGRERFSQTGRHKTNADYELTARARGDLHNAIRAHRT